MVPAAPPTLPTGEQSDVLPQTDDSTLNTLVDDTSVALARSSSAVTPSAEALIEEQPSAPGYDAAPAVE